MNVKKSLSDAIYNLLQTNDIEKITTADILKESGVSRATFYRYFKDKYDLMNCVYVSMHLQNALPQLDAGFENVILETCQFVNEHRQFFKNAFKYKGQNSIAEFLRIYCRDLCINACKQRTHADQLSDEVYFAIEYHSAGAVRIFEDWIQSDFSRSPEKHAKLLFSCIPENLKRFL